MNSIETRWHYFLSNENCATEERITFLVLDLPPNIHLSEVRTNKFNDIVPFLHAGSKQLVSIWAS